MDIYFITIRDAANGKDKNKLNNLNWIYLKYSTIVWGFDKNNNYVYLLCDLYVLLYYFLFRWATNLTSCFIKQIIFWKEFFEMLFCV